MKNRRRTGVVAGLSLLGAGVLLLVGVRTERPGGAGEVEQRLTKLLHELVARADVQHAIVAVESGDGSFRWIGVAGDASPDGTPMREDTPFFLASVSKLYLATAVLKLHERGQLGLDDPISAHLPQSLLAGLHRLDETDHTGVLTIRHLLSHTSGLPDYLEESPAGGRSLRERLSLDGDSAFSVADALRIVRDDLRPHFPPQRVGERRPKIRYSETNYLLLIAIIEAVTGQGLHEALTELLFVPLDLRHTHVAGHPPREAAPRAATLWLDDRPLDRPLALRSTGDLYSTAEEALRFMRALSRGEVFDEPATLALMQSRWNRFGLPRDRVALRTPGWPIEYGLGIMRFRLPRLLTPLRPMPAVLGHTGSTGAWLFYCPELDLFLTGTVDQAAAGAVPYRVVPRLLRILAPAARGQRLHVGLGEVS